MDINYAIYFSLPRYINKVKDKMLTSAIMYHPDEELLDISARFHDGVTGIMQLFALCHIDTEMKLKRYT